MSGLLGLEELCWFLVIKPKPAQITRTMKSSEMRVLCTNQQHHGPNMAAHIIHMLVICFCLMQAALVLCSMVAICSKQQTCHLFVIAAKKNEEASIEHTVNRVLKMNLKKAGSDERPWPVSKQMKTILILQLKSEAEDLVLKRYTEVVAQDSKKRMAK